MKFKVKKTHTMNSLYKIKPFEKNIIHFDGLNRYQRYDSLFTSVIWRPLYLLSQLGTKE